MSSVIGSSPIVENRVVLSGSFNPLHDGHIQLVQSAALKCGNPNICFEMTLNNADKGLLQVDDPQLIARIKQFSDRKLDLALTNQGLFVAKAQLMPNCHFVIGYDTFIRILNPKYYSDSPEQRSQALSQIQDTGSRFIVGGRMQDQTFEQADSALVPSSLQQIFLFLGEDEFRNDISSTQLRASG